MTLLRPGRRWAALIAVFLCAAPALAAQEPADTLAGRVIASDSTPIPYARIRATATDGRELAATTGAEGRYLLVFTGGSGAYALQASAFGYLPFSAAVQRAPGAGRIVRDFRLSPRPLVLDEVRVVASVPDAPAERAGRWDALLTGELPLDPGDFAEVGSLVPGVVRSGDGLSMAGQSPEQNGATVDGATFGGGSLPSEGVRAVNVLTTTYDVSRGQFSGGQVAATTIAGTNLWGGAATAQLDDPGLRYGGPPAGLAGQRGRFLRLSAGGGGALVRDRLFVYGALDVSQTRSSIAALERLDSAALREIQVAPDSALRFAQIAGRLGAAGPGASPLDAAANDAVRALGRVDWMLSRHGALTARLDWRSVALSGVGASPLRLSGGTGRTRSGDGGVMLQHVGSWSRAANELRLYRSAGDTRADEDAAFPTGVVRVSSLLEGGASESAYLAFGGTNPAPGEDRALWEIGDDLKVAAGGGHQLRAGFTGQEERASREAYETAGTFTFLGLDALERGEPAAFSRVLGGTRGEAVRRYGALYLGDQWSAAEGLALIYGVRAEGSRYADRPELVPSLASLVGPDAARVPADFVLTPRIGFDYRPRGQGKWNVEGGIGGFAGVPRLAQLAPRWGQAGAGELILSCIGPAAPAAEWARYAADPASVPATCADGSPTFSGAAPSATVFARDFRGPRTWRASLGAARSITPRWGVRLEGLLVRGTGLPTALDRNLHGTPLFTLAGEENRPVYAAPEQIVPGSGGIAPGAGRVLPRFGAVDELVSRGESWTAQLTAGANGSVGRTTRFTLRYTFTHARMRAGGIAAPGAPVASTAGDPARLEWMDVPFTPRHHLHATLAARPATRLRVSAIASLASGMPFTPLVRGDINGDGRSNDRPFVFAPGQAPDPAAEAALRALREEGPAAVRRCLRDAAGRIAGPGSCRTPWSPALDLRAELVPWGALNARRFVLSIDAHNLTAGLDHLLHGSDGLRGWGQPSIPDATLLEVRGFDPVRRTFLYEVNPRFGRPLGGGVRRVPFRVVVEGRITVGADPRHQPLMRAVEQGRGNRRASVVAELAGRMRNVPAAVLALHETDTAALALTVAQRAFLRAAADSLAPGFAAAVDSLAAAFTDRAGAPAVRAAQVQALAARAVALQASAIERTHAILTPAQWERVPAWLKRPAEPAELQRPPAIQAPVP